MSVSIYMDEHIPRAITQALRLKRVDVLTAQEDDRTGVSGPDLLDRATELDRELFAFGEIYAVKTA